MKTVDKVWRDARDATKKKIFVPQTFGKLAEQFGGETFEQENELLHQMYGSAPNLALAIYRDLLEQLFKDIETGDAIAEYAWGERYLDVLNELNTYTEMLKNFTESKP